MADVAGADAAAGQQEGAVVFLAVCAVVGWGDSLAGFGGSLNQCLADAQNGWFAVTLPG